MTGGEIALLVGTALLVVVAGAFAAADTGLSRVSRSRIEEAQRARRRGANAAARVVADPARYLNLALLLRVGAEASATVLFAVWAVSQLGVDWRAVLVGAGVMLVVSYVAVGVAPRTYGRQRAERVALLAAPVVVGLARVLGPLPRLLIALGNALTPGKGFRDGPFTTEAELRDLVDLAEASQVIESGERQMIHSVFELGDTIAREVMVPRTDIVFIERTKTLRQAMSLALRSGFSRIPVFGDDEDDVVGVVYLRDLAKRTYEYRESESSERVESLMRPVMFVPDSKPVSDLLREMQAQRSHLAVAVDEYGGTAGLLTIEDILEEIVGEISDEHDREQPMVEELPDGGLRVSARLPVEDLARRFDVEIEVEDVETVGGLLASALGRVPIPGATADIAGLRLVADEAAGRRNRIETLVVRPVPDVPAETSGGVERVDV